MSDQAGTLKAAQADGKPKFINPKTILIASVGILAGATILGLGSKLLSGKDSVHTDTSSGSKEEQTPSAGMPLDSRTGKVSEPGPEDEDKGQRYFVDQGRKSNTSRTKPLSKKETKPKDEQKSDDRLKNQLKSVEQVKDQQKGDELLKEQKGDELLKEQKGDELLKEQKGDEQVKDQQKSVEQAKHQQKSVVPPKKGAESSVKSEDTKKSEQNSATSSSLSKSKPKISLRSWEIKANEKARAFLKALKKPEYEKRIPLIFSLNHAKLSTSLDESEIEEFRRLEKAVASKSIQESAQQFQDAVKNNSTTALSEFYLVGPYEEGGTDPIHFLYVGEIQGIAASIMKLAEDKTLTKEYFEDAFAGLTILVETIRIKNLSAFLYVFDDKLGFCSTMLQLLELDFSSKVEKLENRITPTITPEAAAQISKEFDELVEAKAEVTRVFGEFAPGYHATVERRLNSMVDKSKLNLPHLSKDE